MALKRGESAVKIQDKIRQEMTPLFQVGEEAFDSSGNLHIKVDLREGDIFLPYSGGLSLHSELHDYIERLYRNALHPKNVCIDFYLKEEQLVYKDRIRAAYASHYEGDYKDSIMKIKKNHLIVFFLFFFGIVFLTGFGAASYYLKDHPYLGLIVPEVLSIISWVFIWAGTEKLFFDSRDYKLDKRTGKALKEAKITFLVEKV